VSHKNRKVASKQMDDTDTQTQICAVCVCTDDHW